MTIKNNTVTTWLSPEETEAAKQIRLEKNNTVIADAKYDLLKLLDQICASHNIPYFAFANLLIGCVHYQDFIPMAAHRKYEIGLLRQDYENLLVILRNTVFPEDISFSESYAKNKPRPYVLFQKKIFIEKDNATVARYPAILLSPFDRIPDSNNVRIPFLDKMASLNHSFSANRRWRSSVVSMKKGTASFSRSMISGCFYGIRSLRSQYNTIMNTAQKYQNAPDASFVGRVAINPSKIFSLDELFPLQRMQFRDITLSCPNNYAIWAPDVDEELQRQVSSIQKADLVLLKKFDEVCRKLNIGYFICGGTLLGYMRHGGFIPWDDDVDVAMLRADYNKFLKEAAPLLDSRFFLQTRESDPNIPYLFSKIRLNGTEYITTYNENRDFHKGICLDIFPFDFIPNNSADQKKFKDRVLLFASKHNIIANNQTESSHRNQRALARSQARYIKEATRYNAIVKEKGLTTVASFVPSYTYIKCEDLLPYQDGEFDGIRVMIPQKPDIFLTMQYGDYMKLPPKHMQVAHKLVRWSADIPQEN